MKKQAIYLDLKFDDLVIEKQEAITNLLTTKIQALAKNEGKEFLRVGDFNGPEPKSWQEAYVRRYTIDYHHWKDYEAGTGAEIPLFMWETWQERHVDMLVENRIVVAFRLLEIEVAL